MAPVTQSTITTQENKTPAALLSAQAAQPVKTAFPGIEHQLLEIIRKRQLKALFQPILDMRNGSYIGYEGLIRGPSDSPLHTPLNLFRAAAMYGLSNIVERLCREIVMETFCQLNLPGKLFLNVSPECLLNAHFREGETVAFMQKMGIAPEQVIIELTEHQPTYDYGLLRDAVLHYRKQGFQIAIDDLGEGFSSLRLWSELMPDYVKMDMHFSQGIHQDKVKQHFVQTIQNLAKIANCKVIVEGIETEADFAVLHDIGIPYGQGYLVARPAPLPGITPDNKIHELIQARMAANGQRERRTGRHLVRAEKLLIRSPFVTPDTTNDQVYALMTHMPELHAVPVIDANRKPVGLISRHKLIDFFARQYSRELFGKRSCIQLMDNAPAIVDKDISIQSLSRVLVDGAQHHLSDGFIITENGQYIGIGTGQDLMREITEQQINAARYANPLTLLPGNVAINEEIDRLLAERVSFVAAYCDLDNFKPFNDRYGYSRGDDIIEYTGKMLQQACDIHCDFVGHIGGDDFLILFQSHDWQERCENIIQQINAGLQQFFTREDRHNKGYMEENRQGEKVFVPLVSLSIGAVSIEPGLIDSHAEISTLAASAKKMAKKQAQKGEGAGLFIDRRTA